MVIIAEDGIGINQQVQDLPRLEFGTYETMFLASVLHVFKCWTTNQLVGVMASNSDTIYEARYDLRIFSEGCEEDLEATRMKKINHFVFSMFRV